MEREDMKDAIIASYNDTNYFSTDLIRENNEKYKYLMAKNRANEGFFLI
jgi:hypothetical protein